MHVMKNVSYCVFCDVTTAVGDNGEDIDLQGIVFEREVELLIIVDGGEEFYLDEHEEVIKISGTAENILQAIHNFFQKSQNQKSQKNILFAGISKIEPHRYMLDLG